MARYNRLVLALSLKHRAQLAHQLALLYDCGVPIVRAFAHLAEPPSRPAVRRAVRPVAAALQAGASLPEALYPQRRVLGEFFVRIAVAGEQSGRLDDALRYLERHYHRRLKLYRTFIQAMLYPTMLVFAAAVVIPIFEDYFLSNGAAEAWAMRSVWRGARFFGTILFWIAVLHISVRTGLFNAIRRRIPRALWPLGDLNYRFALGRYLYAFALLLDAGLPVASATVQAARAADHAQIERHSQRAKAAIEAGSGLAESLVRARAVPRSIALELQTAEHSGRLVETLAKLSEDVEDAAYHSVTIFVTVAGVVGLLVALFMIF